MVYREAPKRAVLSVRPDPIRKTLVFGVFATLSLLFGVPSMFFGKTEGTDSRAVPIVFGLLFSLGGILCAWLAYAAAATRVHLSSDGGHLDIRWTRFGKEVRHERVPIDLLVDVGVHDTPASGEDHHHVVIGTRHGDIALSRGYQGAVGHYLRKRDELASFLALPVRPWTD